METMWCLAWFAWKVENYELLILVARKDGNNVVLAWFAWKVGNYVLLAGLSERLETMSC